MKTTTIKPGSYWILQRFSDRVEMTEFTSIEEMDQVIEDIVVTAGEQNKESNIIYESISYAVRQAEISLSRELKAEEDARESAWQAEQEAQANEQSQGGRL